MNRRYLWAIMALALLGLTITEPDAINHVNELPAEIHASWTGGSSSYNAVLSNDTEIIQNDTTNSTHATYLLFAGEYTLLVTGVNESDQQTFTVELDSTTNASNESEEQEPPDLNIAVERQSYEIGENVRLSVSTDRPVTAQLKVKKDGETIETYTLSVTSSLNLIYIPEYAGGWEAILSAEGTTVSASFTVEQEEPLTIDFTHDDAVVDEATNFTAQVSGGEPPYTYKWLFSDDTTSSGATSTHYFFEEGEHSATLVVKDSKGTQESKTKTLEVHKKTYKLEITVRNQNEAYLNDIDVTLTPDEGDDITKTTDNSGFVKFNSITGKYKLTLTQLDEEYYNDTINISENTNLLLTIEYGENEPVENETNTSDEETVEETPQEEEQVTETLGSKGSERLAAAETEEERLEAKRQETLTILNERKFNAKLSAQKDEIAQTLNLYKSFDDATTRVKNAKNEEDIEKALENVLVSITVLDEESRVDYPSEKDVDSSFNDFLQAKRISDEDLADNYKYSIKQILEEVSIETEYKLALVEYPARSQHYTMIERTITAPTDTYIVEIIPKSMAKDISNVNIKGEFEVIESDPVIKITSNKYSYSIANSVSDGGKVLVVPQEIKQRSSFSGFLAIKLGEGSSKRSLWYAVIIALAIIGVIAGRSISKRGSEGSIFDSFAELTEMALDKINYGDAATAARLTPEIESIYETLTIEQKVALADVMKHLKHNQAAQAFISTISRVYETTSQSPDINNISQAYEELLTAYEGLPPELQETLKHTITELDNYLDQILPTET